jgi:response regulator RpfG family c-di-GMP phosphodiesterase
LSRGDETILLVEDERSLRVTCRLFLQGLGYTVLVAETPAAALALAAQYRGEIHLLLTDVIMPGMGAKDMVAQLLEVRPQVRCLYMSGYPANVIDDRGIPDQGVHFLAKPFSRVDLVRKVRETLDA